ncbi:MAG: hydrogenase 4 subunit B, partial [Candidatus Phosphoribacter sp.]
LGLLPGVVAAAAASAVGAEGVASVGLGGVALPAVNALLDPTSLAVLGGVCTLSVLLVTARFRSRHPRRTVPLPWGCGGSRVDPRMQYTATSFAEPLVRVFDNALRPATDVHVTPAEESRYLVQAIAYRQQVVDRIETRGYQPLLAALDAFADKARALQNGSMVRYLGYSFAALVVVLLVVTW